jgi:hypothetical protein
VGFWPSAARYCRLRPINRQQVAEMPQVIAAIADYIFRYKESLAQTVFNNEFTLLIFKRGLKNGFD